MLSNSGENAILLHISILIGQYELYFNKFRIAVYNNFSKFTFLTLENIMKWYKSGNFDVVKSLLLGSSLIREVFYRFDEENAIIKLFGYATGEIFLVLNAKSQVLTSFKESAKKFNILNLVEIQDYSINESINEEGTVEIRTTDKELLKAFILTVNDVLPIEQATLEELFKTLGIKKIVNINQFLEEKVALIKQGKFTQALTETLASTEDEALWQLACYLEKEQNWQHAIECYQDFLPTSLFYVKANLAIYQIIQNMLNAADMGEISLVKEEGYGYKQHLFSCLNNLPIPERNEHQSTIDNLFSELCGKNFQVDITNVANDNTTLLDVASSFKTLSEENEQLKMQLSALKAQIAQQKQGLFAVSSDKKDSDKANQTKIFKSNCN